MPSRSPTRTTTTSRRSAKAADRSWLRDVNELLTSVTTKTHSMRLYEAMGRRAGVPIRPYLFGVLSHVHNMQPVRISDVAEQMDYDRSTISRHVGELVALGCIDRQPDPDDGRVVILRLTDEGRQSIDRVYRAWMTLLAGITADWADGDRQEFLRLFSRFDESLSAHLAQL